MGEYTWDNLDKLYIPPKQLLSKGEKITIILKSDKPIGELNEQILESFFSDWTYPTSGKFVKPLKLCEYVCSENSITAKVMLKNKNFEMDEIRLLLQDVLDILNYDGISVKNIEVEIELE